MSCGCSTETLSRNSASHSSTRGASTRAAMAAAPLAATSTRRITPRLRKSGSAGRSGFCLIIGRITGVGCKLRAGNRASEPRRPRRSAISALSAPAPGEARKTALRALPAAPGRHFFPRLPLYDDVLSPPKPPDSAAGTWSGRFSEPVADRVKRYTASVDFDRRLAVVDIVGSLAHARMLAAVGVLSTADLGAIEHGMVTIRGEIERGEFTWSRDFEDVHLNIEHRLTTLVGEPGKRLHTARSRNDQVATDLRLWLRGEIDALNRDLGALRRAFLDMAERHADTIMPGFT